MANLAVVYDRRIDGKRLTLTHGGIISPEAGSFMVLYDHQTGSYWWEGTGRCVKGACAGRRLDVVPFERVSWSEWRRRHPDSRVFSWKGSEQRDWHEPLAE